jgi:tetratricopeptide (TPR) repeat protein
VAWTPFLLILDPAGERAAASHIGGMTLPELEAFLDRGAAGVRAAARAADDAALAEGDARAGRGALAPAAEAYREALRVARPGWPQRLRTVDALVSTLVAAGDGRGCAEAAAAEAPMMARGRELASVAHVGLGCAVSGGAEPWAVAARTVLAPLAAEAVGIAAATRDDRFQLYQQLMHAAAAGDDRAALRRWGEAWLAEIDAAAPAGEDERSALDIARVDAVDLLDEPARALPALEASERAMPRNYTASARLARVAAEADRYDVALAACARGLARGPGPYGRFGLHLVAAQVWRAKGDARRADAALAAARRAAAAIGSAMMRAHALHRVEELSGR